MKFSYKGVSYKLDLKWPLLFSFICYASFSFESPYPFLFGCLYGIFFLRPVRVTDRELEFIGPQLRSPVDGIVLKIWEEDSKIFLALRHRFFGRHELFMPATGVVSDLGPQIGEKNSAFNFLGKREFVSSNRLGVMVFFDGGVELGAFALKLIDRDFWRSAKIQVSTGDKISTGPRIGQISQFQEIVMVLNKSLDIKVSEGQEVIATDTILALPKSEK